MNQALSLQTLYFRNNDVISKLSTTDIVSATFQSSIVQIHVGTVTLTVSHKIPVAQGGCLETDVARAHLARHFYRPLIPPCATNGYVPYA